MPAFAGPDADGYFAQARMIAFEGRTTFEPEVPARYLGMHWIEKPNGEFVSRYPAGFPVLLAAVWKLFGRDATFYLNPLMASLTVGMIFLLARRWVGDGPALCAALIQAAYLTANHHALNSDSHTATAFFLIGGVLAFDRWDASGNRALAFLGGLALGMVPAVRYAEAAAGLGAAAFVFWIWRRPERRNGIPWAVAGAAGPVLLTAARNQIQFGAPWRTAYALTGESSLSLEYFRRNWSGYLDTLSTSGVGLFFVLGLLGMLVMLRDPERRPFASLLLGAVGGVTLVYCCYYIPGQGGMGARFLYPTLPLYLVPAMLLLRDVLPRHGFLAALAVLTGVQALHAAQGTTARLEAAHAAVERSAAAVVALEDSVPHGSVILGDRRVHEQIHFTGQWKLADSALLGVGGSRIGGRRRGAGRPGGFGAGRRPAGGFQPGGDGPGGPPDFGRDGPSPMQHGKGQELRAEYSALPPRERSRRVLADLRDWAGDQEIYWVGPESQADSLPFASEPVLRVELPEGPLGGRRGPDGPAIPGGFGGRRPGGFPPAGGPPGGGPGGMFGLDAEPLMIVRVTASQ